MRELTSKLNSNYWERNQNIRSLLQSKIRLLSCSQKSNPKMCMQSTHELLMNQLHSYCILNVQLMKIMFQSKGPYLLNILSSKQNVEVKKRSKKCSKFKCHHYKRGNTDSKVWLNQIKTWRMFKNSALIGYFARNC